MVLVNQKAVYTKENFSRAERKTFSSKQLRCNTSFLLLFLCSTSTSLPSPVPPLSSFRQLRQKALGGTRSTPSK